MNRAHEWPDNNGKRGSGKIPFSCDSVEMCVRVFGDKQKLDSTLNYSLEPVRDREECRGNINKRGRRKNCKRLPNTKEDPLSSLGSEKVDRANQLRIVMSRFARRLLDNLVDRDPR